MKSSSNSAVHTATRAKTYFAHDLKPWVLPMLATALLSLMFLHKSESPVVFHRYSLNYAILLTLALLNVGLLWRKLVMRVNYLPYIVLVLALTCLFDFLVMGLGVPFVVNSEPDWGSFVLGLTFLVQIGDSPWLLRRIHPIWESEFGLTEVAIAACSLLSGVILMELVLRFTLLEKLTPKNQREFLSLMSSQWSQPVALAKPAGTLRIVGLADSFGVVGGQSGNYHYILERMLRQQLAESIQMVNVSVTGYAPRHELAMLRFAMPYSPDIVLYGFFVGNDFTLYGGDTYRYRAIRIDDQPGNDRYRPRDFFLTDLIRNHLSLFRDRVQASHELRTGVVDQAGHLSKNFFLEMQWRRMNYLYKASSKDDMTKIIPVLGSIRHTVEKGGARHVMIIHPDQTQVDVRLRQEITKTYKVSEDGFDFDFPQRFLTSYCASSHILCVDLLPRFRADGRGGDLYTVRDGHYNLNGNRLTASAISQFLFDKQLLGSVSSRRVPGYDH